MNIEKLKVIAEGMGYKAHQLNSEPLKVYIYQDPDSRLPSFSTYNPLTNAEQCMEIMEKLLKSETLIEFQYLSSGNTWLTMDATDYVGKTINEAVCNAAYEYFKEEDNEPS